ncbi:hypothetical protein IFR09_19125 [Pseudomonas syringae]|nr:hypothetical protein [Pseudomonas syringae]MBD8575852.1 hypothetical protein [Pseudomonas syringae]MBD8792455.1 hypothetical protein [Pseudomonas syringae]MBD8802706.1 hypothetical protein [Pseudomonas syringae]MBD8813278.1 hypothetical protein [Pseudomonas syringae]
MKRIFCPLWAIAVLSVAASFAQAAQPGSYRFEDSPATPIAPQQVKHALSGANDQIRARFAFVREGVQTPNFAGKYVVNTYGCGTGCTASGIVDLKTGTVYRAPFNEALSDDAYARFGVKEAFRADSNLFYFSNYRYLAPGSPDMTQQNGVARWNESTKTFEILEKHTPYKVQM